jgi:tetratricopeptide (TPR) repeat protein
MRAGAIAVVLLATAAMSDGADPPGTPGSRAALAACQRAQATPGPAGERLAAEALAGARAAVAADEHDPLAHFAVFCALGEELRRRGVSLRSLLDMRALRATIDRTLELAPDFADAQHGKGALLLDSPRLLGGDPAAAERHLRRAIAIDPGYLGPRLDLVRALVRRGATAEARSEAEAALVLARQKGDPADVRAAEALVRETRDG